MTEEERIEAVKALTDDEARYALFWLAGGPDADLEEALAAVERMRGHLTRGPDGLPARHLILVPDSAAGG